MEHIDKDTYNANSLLPLGSQLCGRGNHLPTRLETRWARFFDLLQIPWAPGWPLPFWLPFDGGWEYPRGFPNLKGLWVGVSEFPPSDEMRQICRAVAQYTGHWTHLLVGEPQPGFEVYSWRHGKNIDGKYAVADITTGWGEDYDWAHGSHFDIDFAAHTVPGGCADVCNAFAVMQLESP